MKLNFVISHCGLFQDAGVHVSLTQQDVTVSDYVQLLVPKQCDYLQ